ncbi:MAG: DNA gyrase/topoisomerase IV subunit A [Bacteroidales bacterium]|nr:DNA gyrase/topoisomerase IV subunit A [Bacteroidales bacterium]
MDKEDLEDIEIEEPVGEALEEEAVEGDESQAAGKYDKLLGEDARKFRLSGMFKDWFLDYSSEVILDRAVPHIVDGLKPVQRRVLHAMKENDDGTLTKAAKVVGQVMAYHPHGDASIFGALVQIGQKQLLIDTQGNWGNIVTGDPNAAGRYIECRLSEFAKEVVFNKKTTNWTRSYDGKLDEPLELPAKFPLLLVQGTEGIAVGMASKILPHNFNELIDASIAVLKDEPFELYPDFPTGGFIDCSKYNHGRRGGKVKVRARIEKRDKDVIAITEVPYGKTTQSICNSIMEARKKGKIKISKIDDLTTKQADIVIKLPKDVSPDKTIDALYAFTDCETSISVNTCVIIDHKPEFIGVDDVLRYDTLHTRDLLQWELEIRLSELEKDWHYTSLEKIFFENEVYKILEDKSFPSWEKQLEAIFARMKEFQELLREEITMEDIEKLVEKPVRKISKFDIKAANDRLAKLEKEMKAVKHDIAHITEYTIRWFEHLKEKYGEKWPRLTTITSFETIAASKVVSNNAKLYANKQSGFVGMNLKRDDNGEFICDCSDISEVIAIAKDGRYKISRITDKSFFYNDLVYVGVFDRGDSRTVYNVIYKDGKTGVNYAKRFNITSVSKDNDYNVTMGTPGSAILWLTANHNGEAESVKIRFKQQKKLKKLIDEYDFSTLAIKGRTSRGNIVSKHTIQNIQLKSLGVSTISGKDIWFDEDIQRLNEDGHGLHLGQFNPDDRVLAIFKNGTYYTTSFDLSSKYQGELLRIEKLDPSKVWTALYYDGLSRSFYIKRFRFEISDNAAITIASEGKGSYLVALSDDKHPRFEVTFAGKWEQRLPEVFEAEDFIACKGIGAKGKKVHDKEVKSVRFLEPLIKPEDEEPEPIEVPDAEVEPTEAAAVKAPAAEPAEVPSTNVIDTEPVKKEEVIDIPDELLDVEIMDIEIEDKEPTLF